MRVLKTIKRNFLKIAGGITAAALGIVIGTSSVDAATLPKTSPSELVRPTKKLVLVMSSNVQNVDKSVNLAHASHSSHASHVSHASHCSG